MDDFINKWAENLTEEVYSEYKKKYSFWKPGFKVFYSPIHPRPALMVISYQPGGSESYFTENKKSFEKANFQLPTDNAYIKSSNKMAKRIQRLFDFSGGLKILGASTVFPLIFFRASRVHAWQREIPKTTRIEMESFSFTKVKEIIETLQPEKILILGMGTYDQLKKILTNVQHEKEIKNGNSRILVTAQSGLCKLFAIVHPSGARISSVKWDLIRKSFQEWIKTAS